MQEICIAHLSDLHISDREAPTSERVRENLVADLRSLLLQNGLRLDAVAITGDVVDRGGSDGAFERASEFIGRISEITNTPLERLVICPGNHDFTRSRIIASLLERAKPEDLDELGRAEEVWESIGAPRSRRFDAFVAATRSDAFSEAPYGSGVQDIMTDSGRMRFVVLDSAWSSVGARDHSNLVLGQPQHEGLRSLVRELPRADLTVSIMHHPPDWLCLSEQRSLREMLRDLSADVLLHGHFHRSQVSTESTPDTSLTVLGSGIGYPPEDQRQGTEKPPSCRYSVYRFRPSEGELDVWLRISTPSQTFAADTQLYTAGRENGTFSIRYGRTESPVQITLPHHLEVDPVPVVPDWVGRSKEFDLLLDHRLKAIAITGMGGQGKTALAAEFLRRQSRGDNPRFHLGVWVNCRELPDSLHMKIIQLLDSLSGGKESAALYRDERLEDTSRRFVRRLQEEPTLVVLDNIDAYVKPGTESPSEELKPILDSVLNSEHESLVLFTCRPPFHQASSAFRCVQLPGLGEDEGVEFFRKRGLAIEGDNGVQYCREVVRLTNGHPWWLGIINGQIVSNHWSLRRSVETFGQGGAVDEGHVKDYFRSFWRQLSKDLQKVLRYLVESHRPLTDDQISVAIQEIGPEKLRRNIRRLVRLGLLDMHEGTKPGEDVYQVHPLIREFVHQSYSPSSQRPYASRVLCVFLRPTFVYLLFRGPETPSRAEHYHVSPGNLADSVETCLNSRNNSQALWLLAHYGEVLYDNGHHHQFHSLACRALGAVNWQEEGLVKDHEKASLLGKVIELLVHLGHPRRADHYLRKYESLLDANTPPFLEYLDCRSYVEWLQHDYSRALETERQFQDLVKTLGPAAPIAAKHHSTHRGLILRDSGRYAEAMEIFQQGLNTGTGDRGTELGNIARCLMYMREYDRALEMLRDSLLALLSYTDYIHRMNVGYAYQWIAEVFYQLGQADKATAFLTLAKNIWEEYAPGLLPLLNDLRHISSVSTRMVTLDEARGVQTAFLDSPQSH